nr:GerAB/ArcD/ProY family transporter [Cohnella zeiphila]
MIWAIFAAGVLSQLNLWLLSKWFASRYPEQGRGGFVNLFGGTTLRFLAAIGLVALTVKIIVITLGYTDIIQQFIFPTMNRTWLILFPAALACFIAMHGMESLIRFVVIAFLCTFWILILFLYFWFAGHGSIRDLYPILPPSWSAGDWNSLLLLFSSLSGPEYLVCLAPWLNPRRHPLKYMSIGNTMTILEYLVLFATAVIFYGPRYLSTIRFPVVDMTRYFQSPIFERIDIFVVPIHMIYFIYALSLFLLLFFGGVRIVANRANRPPVRTAFLVCCAIVTAAIACADEWSWESKVRLNIWQDLQIGLGAAGYAVVPLLLVVAIRRKGRA